MKKLPFSKMLFLTSIAFFTFNTLNANSSSIRGLNYDISGNDNGQTYTASLRCGECHQANLVKYHGYYTDGTKTYFFVTHISCSVCSSDTKIEKRDHISELDINRLEIINQ